MPSSGEAVPADRPAILATEWGLSSISSVTTTFSRILRCSRSILPRHPTAPKVRQGTVLAQTSTPMPWTSWATWSCPFASKARRAILTRAASGGTDLRELEPIDDPTANARKVARGTVRLPQPRNDFVADLQPETSALGQVIGDAASKAVVRMRGNFGEIRRGF